MSESVPARCLQLLSKARSDGFIELSLGEVDVPAPGENEVTIRVEAAPINPSDLGLLVGPADVSGAIAKGTSEQPVVEIPIDERVQTALTARLEEAMPVGNEGAGVVVAAGAGGAAQALLGKVVVFIGGAITVDAFSVASGSPLEPGMKAFIVDVLEPKFTPTLVTGFACSISLGGLKALQLTSDDAQYSEGVQYSEEDD